MQQINRIPINKWTLMDFVGVVQEINWPPKLAAPRPEGTSLYIKGEGLVTLVNHDLRNVYITPESSLGFYHPEDPWYVPTCPVWTEADNRRFMGDINSHSFNSHSMYRGHFLNDVLVGVSELERKGEFPRGIPEDVLKAYRDAERRISGIKIVY